MNMTKSHISWISSIVPLVAVVAAPLSSPLCALLGRRVTMMSACIPMCVGWLIITYATNANMILIGRAMCAAVSAISLPAAYTYVAEIASTRNRGFLGSLLSVGWTFGLVLSYTLGSVLEWNWLALTSSVVSIVQFIVLSAATPSPRWLLTRKRTEEAKDALTFFRGEMSKHVECELKDCEHQINEGNHASFWQRIRMMVTSGGNRKSISICLGIYFFAVGTGFIVVNYHAKMLLVQGKVTDTMDANLGTIIIGLCQMGGNIISAFIVDRVGRKNLLYISSTFVCLSQAGIGTYFYLEMVGNKSGSGSMEEYRLVPLILLLIFVVFLPIGWGSVTYILVAELVPTTIRTETIVLCNAWEQLLQFLVLRLHSSVCSRFGPSYLHWGFAILTSFAGIFAWVIVPETSNRSLEDIEVFFTHLRREAMDMIGDRAACREPIKEQPFVRIKLSKEEKTKQIDSRKLANINECKKINLEEEIDKQVKHKQKYGGKNVQFTDINLNDCEEDIDDRGNEVNSNNSTDNESENDGYFQNMIHESKSRK